MELADVLHQMMEQSYGALSPTDLSIGTVTSESPLSVSINPEMAPIKSELLYLTWPVISHVVKLPTINIPKVGAVDLGEVEVTRALQKGDRVIMLRVQRGQKFIILSRIEEG